MYIFGGCDRITPPPNAIAGSVLFVCSSVYLSVLEMCTCRVMATALVGQPHHVKNFTSVREIYACVGLTRHIHKRGTLL